MFDVSIDESKERKRRARERVDKLVIGNAEALRRVNEHRAGWALNLFSQAGEASGSFRSSNPSDHNPRARYRG